MNSHEETTGARLRTWCTDREIRDHVIFSRARSRFRLWLVQATVPHGIQATVPHEFGLRLFDARHNTPTENP